MGTKCREWMRRVHFFIDGGRGGGGGWRRVGAGDGVLFGQFTASEKFVHPSHPTSLPPPPPSIILTLVPQYSKASYAFVYLFIYIYLVFILAIFKQSHSITYVYHISTSESVLIYHYILTSHTIKIFAISINQNEL